MDNFDDDEIVISGISGRYPHCQNTQELMEHLMNGDDMTSSEHSKWSPGNREVPHKIGSLKSLNKCDAQFFGIIRKHCNSLDPVTRQILERTLEAIIDAGLNPQDLKGSNTAVFISLAVLETEMVLVQTNEQEMYGIMGRTRALNANRLSYWLDLKGPSMAIDCFFNGGLQAIQEAYYAIKTGKVDAAIVGSGSTIIHPQSSYQYDKLRVLSPDGNTRAFDAEANGYARAEAVSVLLLQRARDAKRNHGTILHILNQSISHKSCLILEPSQENWLKLYEKFYSECKVDPKDVSYLEADGVANLDMDAAELNAVGKTFCKGRSSNNPLLVGSVKSNMGHAEGAANLCAVAKLVIAMENDTVPGNLHYKRPNPLVQDLVRGNIKVVTESTPLQGDLVALNSFGMTNTYGHLLLRKNRRNKKPIETKEAFPQIFLFCSRNEEEIEKVVASIEAGPFDPEYANLVNNAFGRGLQGHMYRGYTVLPIQDPPIRSTEHYSGNKPPVWFIFAGMGSQWPAMALDLLCLPSFKRSIEISAKLLKSHGVDLIHLLTHDEPSLFDNILNSFVSIVSVQIALVDVLRDIGIHPDGIIGHSVGETSASYADGCLTQEQTLLSAYYRGRASLETKVIKGTMAAVGLGYAKMKERVPKGIEIACHNGPDSCTLSGPSEQVQEFVEQLTSDGVFARAVNVANIPYHSQYIQEMGPRMFAYLKHVIPEGKERSARWLSSSYPESRWGEPAARVCDANYHINNLLSPVLFEEASKHIPSGAVTIEIAPHGLLQAILKRSHPSCVNITLTNRNISNQKHVLLRAIGRMYQNGIEPKVECLYPTLEYPVSRGTGFISHLVTWDHSDNWSNFSNVDNNGGSSQIFQLQIDQAGSILSSHKQDGVTTLPYAMFLMKVWEVYIGFKSKNNLTAKAIEFHDVIYHTDLSITNERDLQILVDITLGRGVFEIIREDQGKEELLVTGLIREAEKTKLWEPSLLEPIIEMTRKDFYDELLHVGHDYEPELQAVSKLKIGKKAWHAFVDWGNDTTKLLESLLQIKFLQESEKNSRIQKIRKIRKLVIDPSELPADQVQVELDLDVDVIRCGKIELRDVNFVDGVRRPVKFIEEELNKPSTTLPPPLDSLKVSYLQFHGSEIEGKQLAYIGTGGVQDKVMGLGTTDDVATSIKEDAILKWKVPTTWPLEETIAVPLNYSMAYYAVHIVGQLTPEQTIVVTDGTNKLGVAVLRVALNITSRVFVVVNTYQEKEVLQKILPKLSSENILVNEMKTSEQLCLTVRMNIPKGVNLIVNTGSADLIQIIVNCLAPFGIIVEMSDELFTTGGKLQNTKNFLTSASLYSSTRNEISNCPDDIKHQLQSILAEGITSGVVEPFYETQLKDWCLTQTVKLEVGNKKQTNARFQCDPERAYLILGGDPYSWLSIAEWFIQRKASNIIVVYKEQVLNKNLQKKLKHLQEKCNLIVKTAEKLTPELIDHIFTVAKAKIALTMLIPVTPEDDPAENVMETLCKKDTFLVTVLHANSVAVQYCQERNSHGGPTLTVLWNEPLNGKTRGFLQSFDRLLNNGENQIIQINDEKEDFVSVADPYEALLPSSLEQVLLCAQDLSDEVKVTEIQTKSVGLNNTKEVQALFLIPGLVNRSNLINWLRDCLYPVFVVDLPKLIGASVTHYAACVIPKLKSTTKAPYSILGESWGGAVAIETARMLENMGEEVQVFFISSTPMELNYQLNSIDDLDIILLKRVFNIDSETLRKEASWNERLSLCTATLPSHQEEIAFQSLNLMREKAASLLSLKETPRERPLDGIVTCITKKNVKRSHIAWISRKDIKLKVVEPSESIFNDTILDMIHGTVATKFITR